MKNLFLCIVPAHYANPVRLICRCTQNSNRRNPHRSTVTPHTRRYQDSSSDSPPTGLFPAMTFSQYTFPCETSAISWRYACSPSTPGAYPGGRKSPLWGCAPNGESSGVASPDGGLTVIGWGTFGGFGLWQKLCQ